MSLDVQEKNIFMEKFEKNIINDNESNIVFLKACLKLLEESPRFKIDSSKVNNYILSDPEKVRKLLSEIKERWAELASDDAYVEEVVTYKTGQLAKFFDVSQTAINKWIKEGRFIGIERAKEGQHIRIPETASYRNPAGKVIPLIKIIESYEREIQRERDLEESDLDLNEFDFLVYQSAELEEKYGGDFQLTLGAKPDEELTPEERRDKEVWKYFTMRLEHVRRESE